MEFIRRNISDVLADLPEICAAHLPSDNTQSSLNGEHAGIVCAGRLMTANVSTSHGITDAQVEAMLAGSMFGFDCPGADPLNH
jgi:hypothetical protein